MALFFCIRHKIEYVPNTSVNSLKTLVSSLTIRVSFPGFPFTVFPGAPVETLLETLQFVFLQVKSVLGKSLDFPIGNMSVTWKPGFLFWNFPLPFSREFPEKP
jgi:hypothetical protein